MLCCKTFRILGNVVSSKTSKEFARELKVFSLPQKATSLLKVTRECKNRRNSFRLGMVVLVRDSCFSVVILNISLNFAKNQDYFFYQIY